MPPQNLTLTVVRPDDLLVLVLAFRNVDVTEPQGDQPGEIRGAANARLTVTLAGGLRTAAAGGHGFRLVCRRLEYRRAEGSLRRQRDSGATPG